MSLQDFNEPRKLSILFYSFDNSKVFAGTLNYDSQSKANVGVKACPWAHAQCTNALSIIAYTL